MSLLFNVTPIGNVIKKAIVDAPNVRNRRGNRMPYRMRMLGTAVKKLIASRNRLDAFTASDVKHFANDSYYHGQYPALFAWMRALTNCSRVYSVWLDLYNCNIAINKTDLTQKWKCHVWQLTFSLCPGYSHFASSPKTRSTSFEMPVGSTMEWRAPEGAYLTQLRKGKKGLNLFNRHLSILQKKKSPKHLQRWMETVTNWTPKLGKAVVKV